MHLLRNVLTYSAVATLALTLAACSSAPQTTSEEGSSPSSPSPSARPTPKNQESGRVQSYKPINQQPSQSRAQYSAGNETPKSVSYGGRGNGNYSAQQLAGDFAGNPQLLAFIERMARAGFSRDYLYGVFSQVRNRDAVARLWASPASDANPGGWLAYRAKFVNPANIQRGAEFWRQYAGPLQRAQQTYGVPAEYIVGIMGVETRWGRITGKHRVIDALTTSALTNQRRSAFFFDELANFLQMTRSERMDPLEPMGSYAGAMGYGQFMPSSFHSYAVDFDGDGIRDLWNPVDAIGSIANYFRKNGWVPGTEVAVPAQVSNDMYASLPDGFKVKYSLGQLAQYGIVPAAGRGNSGGRTCLICLSQVPGGQKEPWIGYQNFYAITRYNRSNYYAMAVHQLAEAVRAQVGH